MMRTSSSIVALILFVSGGSAAANAACVLGRVPSERTFSLRVNETCVITRSTKGDESFVEMVVTVRPKKGQFGKAGLDAFAYMAGRSPGADYFEYDVVNKQKERDNRYTIRNYVTITP